MRSNRTISNELMRFSCPIGHNIVYTKLAEGSRDFPGNYCRRNRNTHDFERERERERENNGRKGEEEEDFLSSGGNEMTKVSSILKRSRTIGVTRGVIRSVCINRPRGSDNLGYEATSNVRLIVRERCSFGLDRPRVVESS